ncbi:MAG TPA: glycosyltransferase family A protein [Pyrinomonadaceae bacterium]|mgnify:CR=1 FL=1|nr:glycosyl transferase [Blastocatellia bacterium]HRJ88833.1 glycosyltransferase family A protein [Pyrinomonadaceae bacterium]HRK48894.1 glycosyltransferase family A protein [Pyrinomonadaceae bacterium]
MARSLSVIIPAYNYGRFIAEAIESVLVQTMRPVEIVVVDDGSTDDTAEMVARFGDAVKYIRQENAGVCIARNRGVAESNGELIAFLDADDIWEPTKLEKQVAKFAEDARIGLVHCGMREFESEAGKMIALHLDGLEGDVADELLLWEQPAVNVSGSATMVSRNAFENVGGFDPRIKCGEDWDLCYRIAREFKVGFVREPLVNYRNHGGAAHLNVREMERGMSLFYKKAFAEGGEVLRLRRRAMGNFRRVLAGSYFRAGMYGDFLRNAAKSLWYRPSGIGYFAAFPLRRFRKTG